MKIVTVVSDQGSFGFTLLKLSCAINGLNLVALVCQDNTFKGNRTKDSILHLYLSSLDYEEIVLFTDGYDTLILSQESEIIQKFNSANTSLLFSTETNCWPDCSLSLSYPPTNSPYKYLNSGGFIGKAGVIKEMLSQSLKDESNFKFSNQYLWTLKFLSFPNLISLDTDCNIFCTFSPEIGENNINKDDDESYHRYVNSKKLWFKESFFIKDGRLFNKISKTWPSSLHFNGKSKCLIDHDIVDMLLSKVSQLTNFTFEIHYNHADGLLCQ